jgi:hypothetical protein
LLRLKRSQELIVEERAAVEDESGGAGAGNMPDSVA